MNFMSSSRARRIRIVTKTADQIVNNSSVLVNDTDLFFELRPDTRYTFQIIYRMQSASDADLDFSFTAIANTIYASFNTGMNIINVTDFGSQENRATDGNIQSGSIIGTVKTGSTSGTLQLQWAQQTARVSDTTIFEGSQLIVFEE